MVEKLEEIFFERGYFVNSKGEKINVTSLSSPHSIYWMINEEDNIKQMIDYINTDITFTSWGLDKEINAYCKGSPQINDKGRPVQFYRINS